MTDEEIQAAYQRAGRQASQAEIESHRANPGGIGAIEEMLGRNAGGNDYMVQQQRQVGHDGRSAVGGLNREQWRDSWMSSGLPIEEFIKQNGGTLVNPKNGTVLTPFGEELDLVIGKTAGGNTHGWTASAGMRGASSNLSGGGSGGGENNNNASNSGQWNELYNMLRTRAQQGINVDRNDPAVRGRADAFSAQQERARRDYLSGVAESGNPYATGAMQGQERMTAEKAGQASGAFEAELIGREITARRDEIQLALAQMGNMLSESQRLALQKELGYLNARLQEQSMNQQQNQFNARLGFETDDRNAYWDAIRSGLLT